MTGELVDEVARANDALRLHVLESEAKASAYVLAPGLAVEPAGVAPA